MALSFLVLLLRLNEPLFDLLLLLFDLLLLLFDRLLLDLPSLERLLLALPLLANHSDFGLRAGFALDFAGLPAADLLNAGLLPDGLLVFSNTGTPVIGYG